MGYRTYTCPIARSCGGCEWLAVPYPLQLRRKRDALVALLADAAEEDGVEVGEVIGMEEPIHYRHKAATPFAPGTHGRIRCGFYAQGTHRIVPCADCLAEDPRCRPVLNGVARVAERLGISAYDEDRGRGILRHGIVRAALSGGDVLLTVVTNGRHVAHADEFARDVMAACPAVTTVVQNVNERRTNAMLGRESNVLAGPGVMRDSLLGCEFELGATSFYQTNPRQTEVLYRLALAAARPSAGMRLLDAYCGIGTIGVCAAHETRGLEVVGVERGEEAVANARRNAKLNDLSDRCRFVRADATEYLLDARRGKDRFDVVVMDPPRAGATRRFLDGVSELAPERVVYISCNPETQARDVAALRTHGWRMTAIRPVDLFPHTRHLESVVTLSRR